MFRYHQWNSETLRGLNVFVDRRWYAPSNVHPRGRNQWYLDGIGYHTRSSFVVRSVVMFKLDVWHASGFRGGG